jgi:threonine/homoserine/homoserine lactone efflux protein
VLTALLTFAIPCLVLTILPGPDSLVILRGLVRGGAAEGARTALGVLTGVLVWVAAAVLGLSALLRASEVGYELLKIAGASYLVWVGVQSLIAVRRGARDEPDAALPRRRGLSGSGFVAGFLSDVLNPKVGVAFVTFMPGFIPDGAPVGWTSFALGVEFIVFSAVWFALLIVLAGTLSRWMATPHIRRRLDGVAGMVLIGFGVRLATEA